MANSRKRNAQIPTPPSEPREISRLEKILAALVATAVGLSILCFLILLLAMPLGFSLDNSFGHIIVVLPVIGLPLGFLIMLSLLIINIVRNKKGTQPAQK